MMSNAYGSIIIEAYWIGNDKGCVHRKRETVRKLFVFFIF